MDLGGKVHSTAVCPNEFMYFKAYTTFLFHSLSFWNAHRQYTTFYWEVSSAFQTFSLPPEMFVPVQNTQVVKQRNS